MVIASTFEWRKEAPLHFWAKADNARACAYRLSHYETESVDYVSACGYHGDPGIGLFEGYLREAAVSLELIIKATINASNENLKRLGKKVPGMPKHHKIPELWQVAKLPALNETDRLRLRMFQEILEWSGRYPTPKDEITFLKDTEETSPPPSNAVGEFKIRKPISLGWDEYNRIYGIAAKKFNELIEK